MKYFVFNSERKGTDYHEFYKGKWNGKSHFKNDSIYLKDIYLSQDLYEAFLSIIPSFDPNGVTEISMADWIQIGKAINDKESQEIYTEANEWLKDVFKEYGCFTILGI